MTDLSKEVLDRIAEAFKALPNVKKVWVTPDGHYHLNPTKNGIEVERPVDGSPVPSVTEPVAPEIPENQTTDITEKQPAPIENSPGPVFDKGTGSTGSKKSGSLKK